MSRVYSNMPPITLEWNEARMWWDVKIGGPNNMSSHMKLEGALDSIRHTTTHYHAKAVRERDARLIAGLRETDESGPKATTSAPHNDGPGPA